VIVLAVVLGAAPSVFLLVFFYLKDRYEPEPRGHVALAFLKGALATVPIYYAQRALAPELGEVAISLGATAARLYEAGVVAAGVEELTKWIVFLALIYRWEEFDEPLDGLVYGVALALGFATVENVLKVVHDGLAIGVLRAVFAVPAHALFGSTMGFYFGRAKLGDGKGGGVTRGQRALRIALALLVPVLFHAAYDFSLVELHGGAMYAVITLLSLALWVFVLRRVHRAQSDSPFKREGTGRAESTE
jgi:RsiW-degrading membrane proteinase PrsW (M82 family)